MRKKCEPPSSFHGTAKENLHIVKISIVNIHFHFCLPGGCSAVVSSDESESQVQVLLVFK